MKIRNLLQSCSKDELISLIERLATEQENARNFLIKNIAALKESTLPTSESQCDCKIIIRLSSPAEK